ncbi:20796_t:CDS:1, partial [Gigaspora rosea]
MSNEKDFAKDCNNQFEEKLIKNEKLSNINSSTTSNLNQMNIIDTVNSDKIFQF